MNCPPVITQIRSNVFRVWITRVVATTTMVGERMGTMMRRKMFHSLAPSTRAASRTSVDIPFSPADSTIIVKPVQFQTPTMMRARLLI